MAYRAENPYAANGISYSSGAAQEMKVFNYYSWDNNTPAPNQSFIFGSYAHSFQYSDASLRSWRDDYWDTSFTLQSPIWNIAPEDIGTMSEADILDLMQSAFAAGESFSASFRPYRMNGRPNDRVALSGIAHITTITAVPEPGADLLIVAGLAAASLVRRRSCRDRTFHYLS